MSAEIDFLGEFLVRVSGILLSSVSRGYVAINLIHQAIANIRSSSLRFLMSRRKFCKKSSDTVSKEISTIRCTS